MSHGRKEPLPDREEPSRSKLHPSQDRKPISSRIAASAAGLAKEFRNGPSAQGSSSTLDSSLSELSSKIHYESSSKDSVAWHEALPRGLSKLMNDEGQDAPRTAQKSLRTVTNSESIHEEFSHFRNEGAIHSSTQRALQDQLWPTQFKRDYSQSPATISTGSNARHTASLPSSYNDGAEIVRLLSGSSYLDSVSESYDGFEDLEDEAHNGLFDEPMSTIEHHISQRIRDTLPAPPRHQALPSNSALTMHPSFDSLFPVDTEPQQRTQTSHQETWGDLLKVSQLNAIQKERFLAEWEIVLHNYADEVWGYMLPVVKAARSQIFDARAGDGSLDSKVVARLRMILGHMTENGLQHPHGYADGVAQFSQTAPATTTWDTASNTDSLPTLHCSGENCNERVFDNHAELRLHDHAHTLLACPHTGCERLFKNRKDWAIHFQGAHQSLVSPMQLIDE